MSNQAAIPRSTASYFVRASQARAILLGIVLGLTMACLPLQAQPVAAQSDSAPAPRNNALRLPSGRLIEPPYRFLFVVDASFSMSRRQPATVQTVREIVLSSFNNQIRPGERFGIWIFQEDLYKHRFPPQAWDPNERLLLAEVAAQFLLSQKFEKRSRIEQAMPELWETIRNSGEITVFLLTDGERLRGTPFDRNINAVYSKYESALRKEKLPFVTTLIGSGGTMLAWNVHTGAGPVNIPQPDPEGERSVPRLSTIQGVVTNVLQRAAQQTNLTTTPPSVLSPPGSTNLPSTLSVNPAAPVTNLNLFALTRATNGPPSNPPIVIRSNPTQGQPAIQQTNAAASAGPAGASSGNKTDARPQPAENANSANPGSVAKPDVAATATPRVLPAPTLIYQPGGQSNAVTLVVVSNTVRVIEPTVPVITAVPAPALPSPPTAPLAITNASFAAPPATPRAADTTNASPSAQSPTPPAPVNPAVALAAPASQPVSAGKFIIAGAFFLAGLVILLGVTRRPRPHHGSLISRSLGPDGK